MIKRLFLVGLGPCLLMSSLEAVYAPIPEVEKGKLFSARLKAGGYYDDNIFGSPNNEQDSFVGELGWTLALNYNQTDQTHLRAAYDGELLIFDDRPGDSEIDNHHLDVSMDHSFAENLNLNISNRASFISDPDSSIGTSVLQTDQSSFQNRFDVSLNWGFSERFFLINKYRNTYYDYDASALQTALNRTQHLYGLEYGYELNPRTNVIGEYRYQSEDYENNTVPRGSDSSFFLIGADYQMQENLQLDFRVGAEDRDRDNGNNTTDPFAEVSAVYRYTERSFFSTGFTYRLIETSDTATFTDSESAEFEANVLHYLTDRIAFGGSLSYVAETLQGRAANSDVDEDSVRLGVSLSYEPRQHLTFTVSYDYDNVSSDTASREETRNRIGASAAYSF